MRSHSSGMLAEVRVVAAEWLFRSIVTMVAIAALLVGLTNGLTRRDARNDLVAAQAQQASVVNLQDEGVTEIDGVPIGEMLHAFDAVATRSRIDLRFGSTLGAAEAILGLAATGPGAVFAIVMGAYLTGREFERRTWFYQLIATDRRSVLLRKVAAALVFSAAVTTIAMVMASAGASLGGLLIGSPSVGSLPARFGAEIAAVSIVLSLWVLVGMLGGLVTTRFAAGVGAGIVVMLVDAAISLNLAGWGPYLITPRITGLARLWAPTSPVYLVTGRTFSLVWWSAFTGVPGYPPAEGAWVVVLYGIGFWLVVSTLIRYLPWRASP
jgi:hypothetical protein